MSNEERNRRIEWNQRGGRVIMGWWKRKRIGNGSEGMAFTYRFRIPSVFFRMSIEEDYEFKSKLGEG